MRSRYGRYRQPVALRRLRHGHRRTQSFNTKVSMGRLTLNVPLSFAQFEREVTGVRIRDKIAASKAKGIWMGEAFQSDMTTQSWFAQALGQ